jgi:hypothetical protein
LSQLTGYICAFNRILVVIADERETLRKEPQPANNYKLNFSKMSGNDRYLKPIYANVIVYYFTLISRRIIQNIIPSEQRHIPDILKSQELKLCR